MSIWNAQYRRWTGASVGVWRRRGSIARYGLRLCLSGRIIKGFLFLGLMQGFLMAVCFFAFGQFVSPNSYLMSRVRLAGEDVANFIDGVTGWILLYPDVCVDGIYRVVFWSMFNTASALTVITVALFSHRLIASDLASQAIVIYNSKALTRWDYIIGKFAIVATILSLIWIVPVLGSWIIGNAVSPDWSFFWHALPSLGRGLLVGAVATLVFSCLALAVSSLAKKSGMAAAYWILGGVGVKFVADIASRLYEPLAYLNPMHALATLNSGLFRLQSLVAEAQAMLPFFDYFLEGSGDEIPVSNGSIVAPLFFLAAMCLGSIALVYRKVAAS